MAQNLAELDIGQSGIIQDVPGSHPTARRLMDLGFLPGTAVTVMHRAPFGDPVIFKLRGYQIGLRRHEASLIKVG